MSVSASLSLGQGIAMVQGWQWCKEISVPRNMRRSARQGHRQGFSYGIYAARRRFRRHRECALQRPERLVSLRYAVNARTGRCAGPGRLDLPALWDQLGRGNPEYLRQKDPVLLPERV